MRRTLAWSCAIAMLATPAVALAATSSATNPKSTSMSGAAGSMTNEAQIKQKLEKEGYSNIQLQHGTATAGSGTSTPGSSTSRPEYTGTATKNGKTEHIKVNSEGQVTQK
jgi:hypothetical protein